MRQEQENKYHQKLGPERRLLCAVGNEFICLTKLQRRQGNQVHKDAQQRAFRISYWAAQVKKKEKGCIEPQPIVMSQVFLF